LPEGPKPIATVNSGQTLRIATMSHHGVVQPMPFWYSRR
jgi:hypothetical protein